ncbi:hypothetical protein [Luteolibacter sp. LG18]|uniref:hypothetical protein n=1 Tax=Luteolibacter sp. LG18 TaxID=2819286 RepID=UPI002B2A2692|nr:hypothetical protein llg_44130 [Luteolibacter sp. LG18]
MKFQCPHCSQKLSVEDPRPGEAFDCPNCQRSFQLGGAEPPVRKVQARSAAGSLRARSGGTAARIATGLVCLCASGAGVYYGLKYFSMPVVVRCPSATPGLAPETGATAGVAVPQESSPSPQETILPRAEWKPEAKQETSSPLAALPAFCLDQVVFADAASERAHAFKETRSEVVTGGLEQRARRLVAGGPNSWEGGAVEWTMKVDPGQQNYVTVKLWGSDKGLQTGRLILFANGLQVGYRHESDHDLLNQCDADPLAAGRFVYVTVPLPPMLTKGLTSLDLKIVSTGPIWFYGSNFPQYQKGFTGPSRGIYRAYTHTVNRFVPSDTETQGRMPEAVVRSTAGPEVIDQTKKTVIERISKLLASQDVPATHKGRAEELMLLSEAYQTPWTPAYRNRLAVERILRLGDAMAQDFAKDRKFIDDDWGGTGALGQAVMHAWDGLRPVLNGSLMLNGAKVSRKDAWVAMLKYSVDYWRTHRRSYTNQSMIVDAGIYSANEAVALLDPKSALPRSRTLEFLYQSVGIEPWVGSDLVSGGSEMPFGKDYRLITRKGLSRELGYVASYGETILPFARDMAMLTGDRKLREQARRMQLARLAFRYPSTDGDGYRCMKLASEIDNRVAHYPYEGSAYNSPDVREAWWMETAALLPDDPYVVGAAQQSVEDGQYFDHIAGRLKDRDTVGMMRNVTNWEKVSALPKSPKRLPMTPGQPDFVFADEENAVLALKHGDTRLFVNLYYRAERGVNRVARVFELTPDITRIATVRSEVEIIGSGETYTRPDWIDRIRSRGVVPPGQDLHQAWAGEVLPISKRPDDAKSPAYGEWGPFVGKAAFYTLPYGDYLIGLNTTEDRNYTLHVPEDYKDAVDLVSGKKVEAGDLRVGPLSTVVLFAGKR